MISPKEVSDKKLRRNPGRSKVCRHAFSGCVHAILKKYYARYYALSLAELHFLLQWEEKDQDDGESLYDVLPSTSIVADDPSAVVEGQSFCIFQEENLPSCCWKRYVLFCLLLLI